ncbi:MAG TPA: NAD(P)-dependent oxidoreductase [Devosia sp.]|jgi:uronate dehydrogenase|uniref:NAD-dependent epimerase/dehydratase family protein n=1 Tax=Devosia sp. TaxID=1871048 RepID=UPI002DDD9BFE|nr:NAD(P)-dependent oxidoreductase [Devosia sp.]HEV2516715.1 NAD(P)-dependent oxidoreductase [Devosia sp.]
MPKTLLTGASGRLGSHLRAAFARAGRPLLATDLVSPADAGEVVLADLADRVAVDALMRDDVEAVVHFGGMANEAAWQTILDANIAGTYNVFEAARQAGVKRVIYASSYHVLGMHPVSVAPLDRHAEVRPDSLYAVSKLFGENLSRLYHDKFGIACLNMRICAANNPGSQRDLKLWCHPDDLAGLVFAGLDAPELGYRTVFAISDNAGAWYVNDPDQTLGWKPEHSSAELPAPAGGWPLPEPKMAGLQGGGFAVRGHFED